MPPEIAQEQAVEDRNRMLATLMEEWSPLQRDLMAWLLLLEGQTSDFRHQTSEVIILKTSDV
ncbi:MAG TPA: hypothetical protein VK661_11850 [Planctomycetota bacterium]|jgi:hypothetical protein|nr:hypothetical protein [Planctomycetota bacterium]